MRAVSFLAWTGLRPPRPRPSPGNSSGHVAPVAQQILLDQLKPGEIVRVHLEAFEGGDLVQFEQQVAAERVLDPALDEGDRDQPLTRVTGTTWWRLSDG